MRHTLVVTNRGEIAIRAFRPRDDWQRGSQRRGGGTVRGLVCVSSNPSNDPPGIVFLEEAVVDPRHIAIQVLANRHGDIIHLLERGCSVQRADTVEVPWQVYLAEGHPLLRARGRPVSTNTSSRTCTWPCT